MKRRVRNTRSGTSSQPPSSSDYTARFEVLNAAGAPLQPDPAGSGPLPGHKIGATSGPHP
jgi:hypothetical protein